MFRYCRYCRMIPSVTSHNTEPVVATLMPRSSTGAVSGIGRSQQQKLSSAEEIKRFKRTLFLNNLLGKLIVPFFVLYSMFLTRPRTSNFIFYLTDRRRLDAEFNDRFPPIAPFVSPFPVERTIRPSSASSNPPHVVLSNNNPSQDGISARHAPEDSVLNAPSDTLVGQPAVTMMMMRNNEVKEDSPPRQVLVPRHLIVRQLESFLTPETQSKIKRLNFSQPQVQPVEERAADQRCNADETVSALTGETGSVLSHDIAATPGGTRAPSKQSLAVQDAPLISVSEYPIFALGKLEVPVRRTAATSSNDSNTKQAQYYVGVCGGWWFCVYEGPASQK